MVEVNQNSVVNEFQSSVQKCKDVESLMRVGANLFTISYIDGIIKRCWPVFSKRMATLAPDDAGKRVVTVDLPAIFWASYSQCGDGASLDTATRVESILAELGKCDTVILAMDSDTSNRKVMLPEYKSSRDAKPDDFRSIRQDAIAHLTNNGARVVTIDGWESDDVMATIAFRCKLRKQECVIVTDDRDMLQCCGSGVSCYSPRSHEYRGDKWLEKNMGLTPKQVVDYLCIIGKDDVPSVAGIGDKTAVKLLAQFGSFWGIYDGRETLTEKKAEAVRSFAHDKYLLSKDLHTLRRDLEVHW